MKVSSKPGAVQLVIPYWIAETALELLLQEQWWKLKSTGVDGALNILGSCQQFFPKLESKYFSGGHLLDLMPSILVSSPSRWQKMGPPAFSEVLYGLIKCEFHEPSKALDCKLWSHETWKELEDSTGIMRAIHRLFKLLATPNEINAEEFLKHVGCDVNLMPWTLRSFLGKTANSVSKSGESLLPKLLEEIRPGYIKLQMFQDIEHWDKVDWISLARNEPWFFLYTIVEHNYFRRHRQIADKIDFNEKWVSELDPYISSFEDVIFQTTAMWGKIFAIPNGLGEKFRSLAVEFARDQPVKYEFSTGITPFAISLPQEASLLPHILHGLVHIVQDELIVVNEFRDSKKDKTISNFVEKYVADAVQLKNIAENASLDKRTRFAANMLFFFHPHTRANNISLPTKEYFIEQFIDKENTWYLPVVALLLNETIVKRDMGSMEIMGSLLELANGNYEIRSTINSMLMDWREIASAPVERLNNPKMWT